MKNELLDKIKRAAKVVESLRATILSMCDDMDAANGIVEKEEIRLAILETEKLLDGAIMAYNELITQTASNERIG